MNALIERVYNVCQCVRLSNNDPISFKKLVVGVRREFKIHNFDLVIKTKKEKSLSEEEFYVNAYYDAEDDYNNETPVEVIIFHNFSDLSNFSTTQITDFLREIFDAVVHEFKHRQQSIKRNYKVYLDSDTSPYEVYLADPDELDAYALSIAIELLRQMDAERAKRRLGRISVLSKMRSGTKFASPNLNSYIEHFGGKPLIKRLAKKVYKHLGTVDSRYIFK
jgi:hypothetical protein